MRESDAALSRIREILPLLRGYALERAVRGESGASVWHCTLPGAPCYYLKTASLRHELHLEGEAQRLRWMRERGLRVPVVREYARSETDEYLLLDEVPGIPAADSQWSTSPEEVTEALGEALARLHRTSIAECPFDHRTPLLIEDARARMSSGHVREDDFDEHRLGRSVSDLVDELLASIPSSDDLVLTHGDFCFGNLILERNRAGRIEVTFIDCARAGIADRYRDVALAIRSIDGDLGSKWVRPFLDAYGESDVEKDKVAFFALLDEFF